MSSSSSFPQWAIARNPVAVLSEVFLSDVAALMQDRQGDRQHNTASTYLRRNHPSPEALSAVAIHEIHTKACAECVVVLDDDHRVQGVLTAQDLVQLGAESVPFRRTQIKDVLPPPDLVMRESSLTDLASIYDLLQQYRITYVPIVDDGGQLTGLLSDECIRQGLILQQFTAHAGQSSGDFDGVFDGGIGKISEILDGLASRENALSKIIKQIYSSLDLDTILDTTVTELRRLLGCDRVLIYQLREELSGMVVADSISGEERSLLHREVQGPCLAPECLEIYRLDHVRIVEDTQEESLGLGDQGLLTGLDSRAAMMVPILLSGQLWGVMVSSYQDKPFQWPADEIAWAQQLARHGAIAIKQALVYGEAQQELKRRQEAEQTLAEVNQGLEEKIQKRTLELQEQKNLIQAIFDTVPMPIFWKDRNSVFQGTNLANLRVLGIGSLEEYVGKTDFDFPQTVAMAAQYQADDRTVMESGEPRFGIVETIQTADQQTLYIETNKAPLRNVIGDVIGLVGIWQDITELKREEARLQALLDQTQLLHEVSSAVRASLDLSTILQNTVDSLFRRIDVDICAFGWYEAAAEETAWTVVAESKAEALPSWMGPHTVDAVMPLREAIAQEQIYRVKRCTGSETLSTEQGFLDNLGVANYVCLPIKTYGDRVGLLQLGRMDSSGTWTSDAIQLLKEIGLQVAIAINQSQLYEESQVTARELEASYQQLQNTQLQLVQAEKMSGLGQLVAGIAHEINNPISFIYGNLRPARTYFDTLAELIKLYQSHYPEPVPAIRKFMAENEVEYLCDDFPGLLRSIQTGANRIQKIVQSLRIFSRLDESSHKAANLHEDIDSILTIVQSRLDGRTGSPAITLHKDYDEALPPVECYIGLLNQVFMNLVMNAIDAVNQRQEESLSIGYQGAIWIRTETLSESAVRITVRDNGTGMDEATQGRMFNPFFTTKPVGGGTGMGLSISYQIVTANHGGSLVCESAVGEGTAFSVELPIQMHQGKSRGGIVPMTSAEVS